MRLLLPSESQRVIVEALAAAGKREVGGILMGEHVQEGVFRVASVTVQTDGGSFAFFVRAVKNFLRPLTEFFHKTNHQYTLFNYLGEWHSHHSFVLTPSSQDAASMRDLVEDPQVGARFAVLLIVRLSSDQKLAGSVTVFVAGGERQEGELTIEGESS